AVDRADRHAWRVRAVHAGHRDRPLAGHAVMDSHHAPPVDAPGHLVLVLTGGHTGVALDAALRIAQELHPCHTTPPRLGPLDPAQGDLGLLHLGHRIIAVGLHRV